MSEQNNHDRLQSQGAKSQPQKFSPESNGHAFRQSEDDRANQRGAGTGSGAGQHRQMPGQVEKNHNQ